MSILQYLDEKRYFIVLYIAVILFVILMMAVSPDGRYSAGDLLYTALGCTLLAAAYLAVGYVRKRSFYRHLTHVLQNNSNVITEALPKPETYEQQLYMELIQRIQDGQLNELKTLQTEKKEYLDFLMSWIHEVKIPITASYMLIHNSSGKTAEELANKLEDELDKIDHYVEQALYYSRIDSFSKDYLITEVSLNQAVRDSVKKYSKWFIHKRIRFTMWEEPQSVHSDSKWLGFIVGQITANALKYTEEGGRITFVFEEDPKEKRLIIRDTGIGIKPEDLGRVFERGFTGSTGRNHAKSTGMGLYLANQMARKLGHDLSIQSEEGKYTAVTIHFPKSADLLEKYSL